MKEIVSNPDLVAYCGLYCGACKSYLKDKCSGCNENEKASWCKIRSCCMNNQLTSCAECTQFHDPNDCKMFNNPISKIIGLIFKSDRAACIKQIQAAGIQGYSDSMAETKRQTIKSVILLCIGIISLPAIWIFNSLS